MKKMIMAVAIVCAAVMAQAATVQWKSGTSIKPDGSTTAASGTLNMFVWTVATEEVYNSLAMDKIWETYGSDKIADMAASAKTSKLGFGSATGGTANLADVANNTTVYGLIITAWDSDKDGTVDMYSVNKATGYVNDSGSVTSPGNLAKYIGGNSASGSVSWQTAAVPEPTSGLLLLLGMAGLALKRKRA